MRNECTQAKECLSVAAHEIQGIFRLSCESLIGRSIKDEREIGSWREAQQHANVGAVDPAARANLNELVIHVTIENDEVVAITTQLRDEPAKTESIQHVKERPDQHEIPGPNVLVIAEREFGRDR